MRNPMHRRVRIVIGFLFLLPTECCTCGYGFYRSASNNQGTAYRYQVYVPADFTAKQKWYTGGDHSIDERALSEPELLSWLLSQTRKHRAQSDQPPLRRLNWSKRLLASMTESGTRRIDVFFYGLFMDEALLRAKGINPRDKRLAAVENFQLVIAQRASLVPSQDHVVHGVVFSLTHDEIDRLYADPSVNMYRPEAVLAKLADGNAVPCLTFNLPALNANEQRNLAYAEKLRAVAAHLNLPLSYVETI